eukprot:13776967-Alexandrium_andersonii.AAC.1
MHDLSKPDCVHRPSQLAVMPWPLAPWGSRGLAVDHLHLRHGDWERPRPHRAVAARPPAQVSARWQPAPRVL